jgi:hypothetical protein
MASRTRPPGAMNIITNRSPQSPPPRPVQQPAQQPVRQAQRTSGHLLHPQRPVVQAAPTDPNTRLTSLESRVAQLEQKLKK